MNKTMKFKTSINCGGCVAKVTPLLNGVAGLEWNVDTTSPDKMLTAKGEGVTEDAVVEAVTKAGFKIEKLS